MEPDLISKCCVDGNLAALKRALYNGMQYIRLDSNCIAPIAKFLKRANAQNLLHKVTSNFDDLPFITACAYNNYPICKFLLLSKYASITKGSIAGTFARINGNYDISNLIKTYNSKSIPYTECMCKTVTTLNISYALKFGHSEKLLEHYILTNNCNGILNSIDRNLMIENYIHLLPYYLDEDSFIDIFIRLKYFPSYVYDSYIRKLIISNCISRELFGRLIQLKLIDNIFYDAHTKPELIYEMLPLMSFNMIHDLLMRKIKAFQSDIFIIDEMIPYFDETHIQAAIQIGFYPAISYMIHFIDISIAHKYIKWYNIGAMNTYESIVANIQNTSDIIIINTIIFGTIIGNRVTFLPEILLLAHDMNFHRNFVVPIILMDNVFILKIFINSCNIKISEIGFIISTICQYNRHKLLIHIMKTYDSFYSYEEGYRISMKYGSQDCMKIIENFSIANIKKYLNLADAIFAELYSKDMFSEMIVFHKHLYSYFFK